MPWFCRPCAIEKHVRLLLQAVKPMGIVPIVATIYDNNWNLSYDDEVQLVKLKPFPSKVLQAIAARTIPDILLAPDIYNFTLRKWAVKKILKEVCFSEVDYIHSVCWPCTSHLIAYDIKQATGKPWIAQFYDPWTDNPYRKIKFSYFRKKDASNESIVAKYADAITHLTPVTLNIWDNRYGSLVKGKQHLLLMTYDRDLYSRASTIPEKARGEKYIISFIGKLFYDRNLNDIIEALKILRDNCRFKLDNKIIIRIIGEISKSDRNTIVTNRLESVFEIVGYLPQNQLEKYYLDSDAFLLIESPQKQNVFFSSKLLDYFIYQRPIIGIGPQVGVTHDLLCKSNNYYVENGDVETLSLIIKRLILNESETVIQNKDYYKEFSPEVLAENYLSIIKRIVK